MHEPLAARLGFRMVGIRPAVLAALFCLGIYTLWIQNLGYPSLSGDESYVAVLTAQPAREILRRLNSDEPHPPVYFLLVRA